jgi:hypothetical protein
MPIERPTDLRKNGTKFASKTPQEWVELTTQKNDSAI